MNFRPLLLPSVLTAMLLTGCQTNGTLHNSISSQDGIGTVNNVQWNKKGNVFQIPDNSDLSDSQSKVIVFRTFNQDSLNNNSINNGINDFEDNVVVGLNDYFQVSLQPGQYSEVATCAGKTNLSAEFTGNKNNHLANSGLSVVLQPKQTYYYQVMVNSDGTAPRIQPIEENAAIKLLNNSVHQTHQISRVKADQCLTQVQPKPVANQQPTVSLNLEVNTPISLDVLFDFDNAQIKEDSHQKLKALADFMNQNPNTTVLLESHTDSKGAASYNLNLSQARADSVKDSLVKKYGIQQSRITTKGYGETQPIDTNDTEAGRQKNRRVVATINY